MISFDEAMRLPKSEILIVATGGQGEPRAALGRIAGNVPVQLYLELTNSLNGEPFIFPELAPVAIFREGVAVKPRLRLKPGIAWFLPSFYSSEKGLEGLIYPAQYALASGEIYEA